MSRFSDDLSAAPAASAPRIFSVPQLRMHLGVSDQPNEQQKIAVARWLEVNGASDVLRRSILAEGWSDLLHLPA